MEVSPLEAEFIKAIRLVQYGKVSAQMIEGIPTRIVTEVSAMLEVGEDVLKQLSDSKKG